MACFRRKTNKNEQTQKKPFQKNPQIKIRKTNETFPGKKKRLKKTKRRKMNGTLKKNKQK